MTKTLKGAYNSEASYSVGDIVKEGGFYYILQKSASAGTHPTNTKYWGLISDPVTNDIMDVVEDVKGAVDGLNPDAKTLVLASSSASSTKKFKITVIDNGTISATEIT